MKTLSLAWNNFRQSFHSYFVLILSMAFTIMIYYDFAAMSQMDLLGNASEMVRARFQLMNDVVNVVLVLFSIVFIGYACRVFLRSRQKEFGTYIFMGLSMGQLSLLYALEAAMTALASLAAGLAAGVLSSKGFVLLIGFLADLPLDAGFALYPSAAVNTAFVFLLIYLVFIFAGYLRILRSSVLSMMQAQKKEEKNGSLLWQIVLSAAGVGCLVWGFRLSVMQADNIFGYLMQCTLVVAAGIVLLFSGMMPLLFRFLLHFHGILWKKERILWMNSTAWRIGRNASTYSMVCVLMLSAITALAAGFAFRQRVQNIERYRYEYAYQIVSNNPDLDGEYRAVIEENSEITRGGTIVLGLSSDSGSTLTLVSYDGLKQLADEIQEPFDLPVPGQGECIDFSGASTLMSLVTTGMDQKEINGQVFRVIDTSVTPYLGVLQEKLDFVVLNPADFQKLSEEQVILYSYQIAQPQDYAENMAALEAVDEQSGVIGINPNDGELSWLKALYADALFIFLVLILASCAILFVKLSNDAAEDRDRVRVLRRMGISTTQLKKSMAMEILVPYLLVFAVMLVCSWFSVRVISVTVQTPMLHLYLLSAGTVLLFMILFYAANVFQSIQGSGITEVPEAR